MKLMTKAIEARFAKLGRQEGKGDQAIVVAKFFCPWNGWTWFATEMWYTLSDGEEINAADAEKKLRRLRGGSNVRPFSQQQDTLSSVPKSSDYPNPKDVGQERAKELELERRGDAFTGVHLPENATPSESHEERLRQESRHRAGEEAGTTAQTGNLRAPQERDQVGRQAIESARSHEVGTPEDARLGQPAPEELLPEIVATNFFGLVVGHETELGYFNRKELENVRGLFGLGIERDLHWTERTLAEVREKAAVL